jgi:hypothetical protein
MMGTLSALSSNLTSANLAANCSSSNPQAFTNLLDTGTTQEFTSNRPNTGTGSGGTHFDAIMSAIQTVISTGAGFGDGSTSSKSRPFVFLITDGMQNPQHYGTYQFNTWNYPGSPSTFAGYSNASFDGSTPQAIDPTLCTNLKNAGATILPAALTSCASSGYFYMANTPTDITNALNAMFQQAVQKAHLTQ